MVTKAKELRDDEFRNERKSGVSVETEESEDTLRMKVSPSGNGLKIPKDLANLGIGGSIHRVETNKMKDTSPEIKTDIEYFTTVSFRIVGIDLSEDEKSIVYRGRNSKWNTEKKQWVGQDVAEFPLDEADLVRGDTVLFSRYDEAQNFARRNNEKELRKAKEEWGNYRKVMDILEKVIEDTEIK